MYTSQRAQQSKYNRFGVHNIDFLNIIKKSLLFGNSN